MMKKNNIVPLFILISASVLLFSLNMLETNHLVPTLIIAIVVAAITLVILWEKFRGWPHEKERGKEWRWIPIAVVFFVGPVFFLMYSDVKDLESEMCESDLEIMIQSFERRMASTLFTLEEICRDAIELDESLEEQCKVQMDAWKRYVEDQCGEQMNTQN